MRRTACLAGLFATSAGILAAAGAPAFADSADNDGINVLDDNNLSVLPIQLCGNNIAVIGAVVPILSPQAGECTNAPVVDHPVASQSSDWPGWFSCDNAGSDWMDRPVYPGYCDPVVTSPGPGVAATKPMPTAPRPVAVRGHHAVTG